MTREELIIKWLDNELNEQELQAFQALDDYDELMAISEGTKAFNAPQFDVQANFNRTLERIHYTKDQKNTIPWTKYVMRIAAVLVIAVGLTYFALNQTTSINTDLAQKTSVELPDQSFVELNASSNLSFKKLNWDNNRNILLEGEAFFKVAKGKTFNVITNGGTVSVLGTQFNVKNRNGLFQVVCYEGSVRVNSQNEEVVLKPGDQFKILDGKIIATEKEITTEPSWINNQSRFKSIPFQLVLNELERQYAVEVSVENIDVNTLFTGTFTHDNLSLALKSITLPLNLKYRQLEDGTIVLSSE